MLWTFCTNAHAARVAFRNVRADGTGVKGVTNVWAQFIGPCVLASSSNCTQPTRPKLILFFTLRIKLTKPKFEPRRPNPKLAVHCMGKAGPYLCDIVLQALKQNMIWMNIWCQFMWKKILFQCGAACVKGFSLLIPLKKHLASDLKENEIPYNKCCKTVVIEK